MTVTSVLNRNNVSLPTCFDLTDDDGTPLKDENDPIERDVSLRNELAPCKIDSDSSIMRRFELLSLTHRDVVGKN